MLHHSPVIVWAQHLTHDHVLSARPDAPVVPDPVAPARLHHLRDSAAGALHRVARWVEPRPVCPSGMIGGRTH